jgi:hypothetical protein
MTQPDQQTTFIATKLAAETAAKAADLATTTAATAVALATKTAETTGIISNDISWMKKSLTGIEVTLAKMNDAFVTAAQHAEVIRVQEDHEERLRKIEDNQGKWMGAIAVITFVISIGVSFFIKLIR